MAIIYRNTNVITSMVFEVIQCGELEMHLVSQLQEGLCLVWSGWSLCTS